ncbi:recombinase family protein [Aeromicrobium sp. CnD17-E]|uniref:recombinase family protein n=1 Tax=Aeromicrobium sp. CnD17-E TaxID=2954487 RepID=UPI00209865D5|nr:recombinase family protein [Aeromicrobium sp. CnD17-E]MCO7238772.1 recombinase family protein [Aeromicrobium sp. CnD17-E]
MLDKHSYTGPRSFTAGVLASVVEWLDAKAPRDQVDGVSNGVVFAVYPDLRPAPKTGNGEARKVARELRKAASFALVASPDDLPVALNEVDGLAARLREVMPDQVGRLPVDQHGHQPHSLDALRAAIQRETDHRGWAVSYIEDVAQSGRRDDRPGLLNALALLEQGEADGLVVEKLDRLGRSVAGLAHAIDHARDYGWSLIALDVGIDSTTSGGRLALRMMSALAEWEAEQIRERTRDGLAAARAKGIRPGPATLAVGPVFVRIVAAHQRGVSPSQIARDLTRDGVRLPSGRPGQ